MKPDDAYKGVLKIGDKVRIIQTGKEMTVTDIMSVGVRNPKVIVEVFPDLYFDIEDIETI